MGFRGFLSVKTEDSAANEFNQLLPLELHNALSRALAPILGVFRLGPRMVPSHGVFALGGKNRYADKRYFATEKPVFSPRS